MDTRHRVGVYAWSPGRGGVHHHRIAEPLRVLKSHGNFAETGKVLDDEILSQVDTVLAHTLHGEPETEAWGLLAKGDTHRLVLDVDDWMWGPDWQPFRDNYTPAVLARLFRNVELAHVVTTPSPAIADYLTRYNNNVHVVPNTVPEWLTSWAMPARDKLTIGYQGSPSHLKDWPASQQKSLAKWLHKTGWRLHLYGQFEVDAPTLDVQITPWFNSVTDYYRAVSMDVGIGPLLNTPFNRAKSSLRAVEYAALGIVAVLPDMPPYRGWVEDGVTGWLVPHRKQLTQVLDELDPDQLGDMSTAARQRALQWTTEANIERWVAAWASQ